ncbi:trypsin-like serine peptidase [Rhizobium laguerreae]|uniref:trypsin-like serine peptidase n=1 Tax=Rhizobium laguerreae TaxID=1076926 RepID=UPI001C91ED3B|nr:serine protease [Rhizobium laguerreae]MBY3343026.1 trypsin-like peptidase domain-containing protein [Rhizobium laguerreae]MBY3350059.1 trypsin-like peptidase domain-containing protein [Rhizobium laguerreae]MBY3364372.1 trypsin-like peptidase domain-containing protein [Rhizobium laguerreae]MBY3371163.1 trypsin-like peptidase domain-containing protein [Rhizobium laguerreae]MBY3384909.1 trypsin-like peptidase domain-containing protein [Rhizobium laguerreae]
MNDIKAIAEPSKRELFDFEREKFEKELEYKKLSSRTEMMRERFSFLKSPLALAILGGIITILVNSITGYSSNQNTITLEREKLQSDLIKKYLEVPDSAGRIANLHFLVESGLIPNYSGPVSEYLKKGPALAPQTVPVATTSTADNWRAFGGNNILDGGVLKRVQNAGESLVVVMTRQSVREWQKCTGFLISDRTIATIGYCVPGELAAGSPKLGDIRLQGVAAAGTAEPLVESVVLRGEGPSDHRIALLRLAAPVAGKQILKIRPDAPVVGDRLIMPFLKGDAADFSASVDDECSISEVDEQPIIAYRCDGDVGAAGAPLVSFATGEVIGIHSWSGEKARFGIRVSPSDLL